MTDNEARARELVRGEPVGAGDGDTYIPRAPTVKELADALSAAETRGRIAGLQEAREIAAKEREVYQYAVEGIAAASNIGKAIDARLAALSQERVRLNNLPN